MRVVINAIPILSEPSGIPNYTYNICKHLILHSREDYTFYYGYFSKKLHCSFHESAPSRSNLRHVIISDMLRIANILLNKIELLRRFEGVVKRYNQNMLRTTLYDVYFEPNFIPINIPSKYIVTTVHDLSFYKYPHFHPDDRIKYFSDNFIDNITRSNAIITVSQFTMDEVREILIDHDIPIIPIYNGYDKSVYKQHDRYTIEHFRQRNRLPENFILFVGSLEPRKNIVRLLQAYLELPEYIKAEIKIVLVGSSGWKNEEMLKWIALLRDHVIVLGKLPVEELALAYSSARLLVYPSIYEGFGLPPLEAMACGCPVVVANAASLPEICANAAHYVDPYDVHSIAAGISLVASDTDYRQQLIERGLQRAGLFSWERSAKEHLQVFTQVHRS
jgi:glycosyltransferase involved in cell wall biosynthesis